MYLIALLTLIIFAAIFWVAFRSLFAKKHNTEVRALRQACKRVVLRQMLSISEVNVFGTSLIAVDKNFRKLVLIIHRNGITWEKCIDVNKIVFCQLSKDHQQVKLQLTLSDDPETTSFPFFDHSIDNKRDLADRFKKAQSWKKKIHFHLSTAQLNTWA